MVRGFHIICSCPQKVAGIWRVNRAETSSTSSSPSSDLWSELLQLSWSMKSHIRRFCSDQTYLLHSNVAESFTAGSHFVENMNSLCRYSSKVHVIPAEFPCHCGRLRFDPAAGSTSDVFQDFVRPNSSGRPSSRFSLLAVNPTFSPPELRSLTKVSSYTEHWRNIRLTTFKIN